MWSYGVIGYYDGFFNLIFLNYFMLFFWIFLFNFFLLLIFFVGFVFFVCFSIYCIYIIIEFFVLFTILVIKFIFSLRKNRLFRKDFLKDLIFYRVFPHNFYETYTQLSFNYVYYPVFYYQNLDYLFYTTRTDEFFDLLSELDTLEDSMEVNSIRKLVQKRLTRFQVANHLVLSRYIFHYTNENLVYSFFPDKTHTIFEHFSNIQDKNRFFFNFNKKHEKFWTFKWKNYIEKEVDAYHDNTYYRDSYKFDEEELFCYFPPSVNPIGFMENLDIPEWKEFLLTDYAILLKKDKDLKKLLSSYSNYKYFIKFLHFFKQVLILYFKSKNLEIMKSGYLTFNDSINANFHFSNFLFFSHIYLQTWENFESDIEESPRYEYNMDFFSDRLYIFFLSFFYIFFLYYCYFFFFFS